MGSRKACQKGDDLENVLPLLQDKENSTFLFSIFTGGQIFDLRETKRTQVSL